ncbi:site-specific DNA-methyltransferase [Erythrobacter donghaensis]|jgi:adenine-specific DNA-methyltransferase|uniref:site-specific DNA-methyltransferase n=1 Tax=Erythrobacter donghaensis TaxID=267135 RepID=UPI00093EE82A|nr:site-specific DNA-methyltransferase [Erythrobacter donghaensis]
MTENENPIPPVTRDDPAAHSGDVVAENVAALKAMFPAIVTDGKVDFEVLRQLLGDAVEEGQERYGLNWKGKARARAFALTPSLGTLRPAKEDSKDWDTTKNIVIEGDNLEVLKLLRKSYAGKVKLIYIDPPYNTGKDFVYPDNYTDSLANYEALTGQRGEDGARLVSNRETSGRFHTDWLNMMYPRLMLAKDLLQKDGLILVSIDDAELYNVSRILDELIGEENYVATLVWDKNRKNDAKLFSVGHEYMLVYARSLEPDPKLS